MNSTRATTWFSAISVILVAWGVIFAFLGLGILPVSRDVLLPWQSALYGAIMIGWGTTLLLDVAVLVLFAVPLVWSMRSRTKE